MTYPLRYSLLPQEPQSGYLTLLAPLRSHKRYITLSNTTLTYGHRPDQIHWTVDMTECRVSTTSKTVCLQLPSGKNVRFRVSKPELQLWYPLFMAAAMGLRQYYCIGACTGRFGDGTIFSGCDRGDGDDIRVWRVGKRSNQSRLCLLGARDPAILELCGTVDRAVRVIDIFEDSQWFHVVTEIFRGSAIHPGTPVTAIKDVLAVLTGLHERGLGHGSMEEAVLVDGERAWVMVYGYAHRGGRHVMADDVKAVGRIVKELAARGKFAVPDRVLALFDLGAPVRQVVYAWFGADFGDGEGDGLDSPRSVLPAGNRL